MADIKITSDSGKYKAGAGDDLEVYNDGSHSYLSNTHAGDSIILATRPDSGSTTTAVTIDKDQNVTIAGNLTVNKAITFNETSVDADFRVESNNNTHMLFVDANNDRVGIATSSPDYTFEVEADASATWLARLYNTGSTEADNGVLVRTDTAHDGTLTFATHNGTSYTMAVQGDGKVGIGTTAPARNLVISSSGQTDVSIIAGTSASAQLQFGDSGDDNIGQIEYNNSDNDMAFYTNAAQQMTIKSDGNVGIGTSAPSTLAGNSWTDIELQVKGTSGGGSMAVSGATQAMLFLSDEDASSNAKVYGIASIGDVFRIDSWNDNESLKGTRLTIDASGNVGIGETVPLAKLDITSDATNTNQPTGINNASDTHTGLFLSSTGNTVGEKYGLQLGGYTAYSVGGIFADMDSTSGNTSGDLTFDMRSATGDAALTERMRITHEGNIGIGTAAPASLLHIAKDGGNAELTLAAHSDTGGHAGYLTFKKSDNTELSPALVDDDDILGGLSFQGYTNAWVEGALIKAQISGTPSTASNDLPTELTFHTMDESTALAQRMVILPNGKVGIGIAAPTNKVHIFEDSTITVLKLENDHESAPQGMQLEFSSASPNNTTQEAFKFADNANNRCIIWSNGDIDNTNNSYSAFSDERIKNSITDASSQWDDIKAIKVRKFKKNSDVLQYGEDAPIHIGVVAQEVESAGMSGLVFEHPADEIEIANNENISEGDMVKSVKYSILYMKAIKALQEAMDKIETLESKVTALENA